MAPGMATMAVNGSPADDAAVDTPVEGVPTPGSEAGSVGEPTAPLEAPVAGSAAEAGPTEHPDAPRPSPRPRPGPPGATVQVPAEPGVDEPDGEAAAFDDATAVVDGTVHTPAVPAARDGATPLAARAPVPAADAADGDHSGASWGAPASSSGTVAPVDPAEAEEFLRLFYAEADEPGAAAVKGASVRTAPLEDRLAEVREEIERTGTYVHTSAELTFGARVAWRNSARCIGRLYWRSLHVRDRRHVVAPDEVAAECVGHLDEATRRGRIRSTITVLAPDTPTSAGPRVWNEQLIRYAGYRTGGRVLGDPRYVGFTDHARSLGWVPPSPMGRFDVLPLVLSGGGEWAEKGPQFFEIPAESVLEVELTHPDHAWFAELGLRWHALPVISNMRLDIGGVSYPAAPFNGWYMATEIGARNLSDGERYDMLGEVAERMGLDTSSDRTMWRDRAAVELTLAVQHSFDQAGVSMADHHGESQRFLRHLEREEAAGRTCPVDWSWIVPPISGGLTPVFHRYYDEPTDSGPMFRIDPQQAARGQGCPF
jgi:nitric-oxide synthase, bacterial